MSHEFKVWTYRFCQTVLLVAVFFMQYTIIKEFSSSKTSEQINATEAK